MATKTATIYASGSAYVATDNPNAVDNSKVVTNIYHSRDTDQSLGYEMFIPSQDIIGKRFVSGTLHIYGKIFTITSSAKNRRDIYAISGQWVPQKTTWNNRPIISEGLYINFTQWNFEWAELDIANKDAEFGADIVSHGFELNAENGGKEYYTSNSDKKPYIEFTYADDNAGLYPTDLHPAGDFIDNRMGATLRWSTTAKKGTIGPVTQSKAIVSWTYGGITKTATVTGAAQSYTIPASQLPGTGTVSWRVTTTDSAGNTYTSADASFTTTDTICYAFPLSPINEYIDGSKVVTLTWTRSISTGSAPNGADFQTSNDGGTTWTNLGHTTGHNNFQAAPGAIPAGNILWRVRGYNTDGVAGPWSDPAAIVVRRAPAVPIIAGVTTSPRPTVSWQSEGQQAYQLQVGDWDSGTVYGTIKTAQVPRILPNGPAAVRLRVQNSFGLWSGWAARSVTIVNTPGQAITAKTKVTVPGIRLTWETKGNYAQYAVYRNGERVGVATGKEFTDYTGTGKAVYVVRGENANGNYTESPRVIETLSIRSGFIAAVGVWDWLPLKCLRGKYPGVETSEDAEVSYTQYSGRRFPVAEFSGHYTRQHKLEFTFRRREDMAALRKMVGELVLYKDMWGRVITGILGGLEVSSDWAEDVSFTITEVDHGTVF